MILTVWVPRHLMSPIWDCGYWEPDYCDNIMQHIVTLSITDVTGTSVQSSGPRHWAESPQLFIHSLNGIHTYVIQANICFTTDVNSIQFSVNIVHLILITLARIQDMDCGLFLCCNISKYSYYLELSANLRNSLSFITLLVCHQVRWEKGWREGGGQCLMVLWVLLSAVPVFTWPPDTPLTLPQQVSPTAPTGC